MTLETAKRIVLEQGEDANREALAVVRGGMVMIMRDKDGRRRGPWVEVLPTETDEESSIERAIEMYRTKKPSPNNHIQPKQTPIAAPAKMPEEASSHVPNEESFVEDAPLSICSFISYIKEKLLKFWKKIDVIVVE